MPGLLQSPEGNFGSIKVIYALVAEFIGTMVRLDLCSDHICKQMASRDTDTSHVCSFSPSLVLQLRRLVRQQAATGETTGHPGTSVLWSAGIEMVSAKLISYMFTPVVQGKRNEFGSYGSVQSSICGATFSADAVLSRAEPCCMSAVFITANISGGHLNPAVTLATIFTGHIKVTRGLAYMFLQICGAIFGVLMVVGSHWLVAVADAKGTAELQSLRHSGCHLLQSGLVPGASVGMGNEGTGCFTTGDNVTLGAFPAMDWHVALIFFLLPA